MYRRWYSSLADGCVACDVLVSGLYFLGVEVRLFRPRAPVHHAQHVCSMRAGLAASARDRL